MKVGTAEPVEEKKKKLRKRPSLSRSSGMGGDNSNNDGGDNGGGDNGNGGGGNQPRNKNLHEPPAKDPTNRSKILMWFLLLVVLMTFGGLMGAYVVLSTNKALEWRPFELPIQVWVSTAIIIASSITYHFARKNLATAKYKKSKQFFIATAVLGGVFISSQLMVWIQLINSGFTMAGSSYTGFFYILTATHAIHVIGGIIALGYIILRTWDKAGSPKEIEKRDNDATAIGWYWHTMDGLWLILVFLLGFWK